jgi:hypothetical protein
MAPKYEFSTENKEDLLWDMNRLQEMGRDVPYEPKPKKAPAPKPESKPAEAAPANPGAEGGEVKKTDQAENGDKKEGEA